MMMMIIVTKLHIADA